MATAEQLCIRPSGALQVLVAFVALSFFANDNKTSDIIFCHG